MFMPPILLFALSDSNDLLNMCFRIRYHSRSRCCRVQRVREV